MLAQVLSISLCHLFARAVLLTLAAASMLFASHTEASGSPSIRLPAPVLSASLLASYTSSHSRSHSIPAAVTPTAHSLFVGGPAALDTDWNGVWRDTGVFFGAQIVAVGIIYLMPESVSGWSREQKRDSFQEYGKNVGHPVMDNDKFYINYILHPYWGATYYTRARERGLGEGASFAYSTAISAMYEFGVESFFERPSLQDLIVTPVAGSLLGAYLFEPLRESIKRKVESRWYYDAMMVITDPVGVLSTRVERLTGRKSSVRIEYTPRQLQGLSADSQTVSRSNRISLLLEFPMK